MANNSHELSNTCIFGDCLEKMKGIPDNCVDLIISDPPYNLSKGNKNLNYNTESKLSGMGGNWDKIMEKWDDMTFDEYWNFSKMWISESKRILKSSGSMWVFGSYHGIGIINTLMQMLNLEILNEIIWYKRNAFPNLTNSRFTASHENILWCHKTTKFDYTFNYEKIKEMSFSNDLLKQKGKQMRTVWDIPNNKNKDELKHGKVPSQKPLSIIERIINCTSNENDLILDPFSGSGTTAIACLNTNRNYICIEKDENYFNIMKERIKQHQSKLEVFAHG